METENTELNGFHFFLLNYDAEDRMQIRRQMKALLGDPGPGGYFKEPVGDAGTRRGCGESPGDRQFLKMPDSSSMSGCSQERES